MILRLPSGKFDTNFLVSTLAAVTMNILRLIGQNALIGKDVPPAPCAYGQKIYPSQLSDQCHRVNSHRRQPHAQQLNPAWAGASQGEHDPSTLAVDADAKLTQSVPTCCDTAR